MVGGEGVNVRANTNNSHHLSRRHLKVSIYERVMRTSASAPLIRLVVKFSTRLYGKTQRRTGALFRSESKHNVRMGSQKHPLGLCGNLE